MKKSILIAAFIFTATVANKPVSAQSIDWSWAKSAGGTGEERGYRITTDISGNVYVTGYFKSPFITFGSTTLGNAGGAGCIGGCSDIFVVKYDATGNMLWAKRAGGTNEDMSYGISTDAGGNVYITGYFKSSFIAFGSTTLSNAGGLGCSGGCSDVFVTKYDAAGNVLWATSAGGTHFDEGKCISTDASGNVCVTGHFHSYTINFGSFSLTNANGMSSDIFIVKYDSVGNALWANSGNGTNDDLGNGITTDASRNVYLTGYFYSTNIIFGGSTLTNVNPGWSDIFVAKYDSSGNVIWVKSAGGTSGDRGFSISTDTSGNVYATGIFYNANISFGSDTLTNAGGDDIYIAKYDSSGNVLWAESAGQADDDWSNGITTDASGNLYVTGGFRSPAISFGSFTLTNASTGASDIFVAKYDTGGNTLWAKRAGGIAFDDSHSVSTDISGNVFVTGFFGSASIAFGSDTLANAGGIDIFTAKLSDFTGIEENSLSYALHIYPNPFSSKVSITLKNQSIKQVIITIKNILGQTVFTEKSEIRNPQSEMKLDLEFLQQGIYFLEINFDGERIAKKIVKQ
jgi:hypothetical protein